MESRLPWGVTGKKKKGFNYCPSSGRGDRGLFFGTGGVGDPVTRTGDILRKRGGSSSGLDAVLKMGRDAVNKTFRKTHSGGAIGGQVQRGGPAQATRCDFRGPDRVNFFNHRLTSFCHGLGKFAEGGHQTGGKILASHMSTWFPQGPLRIR